MRLARSVAAEREVVLDLRHVDAEDLDRVVRVVERGVGERREGMSGRTGVTLSLRDGEERAEAGEADRPEAAPDEQDHEDDADDEAEEALDHRRTLRASPRRR